MKLKVRFSLIAILCGLEMVALSTITMLGANLIHKMQNFQFMEQECQVGLRTIINYINQTIFWSVDLPTVSDDWKTMVINTNKKFRQMKDDPIEKWFKGDEYEETMQTVQEQWQKAVSLINPFNGQMKSLQDKAKLLDDEQLGYIKRYGIKSAANKYTDCEPIQDMTSNTILIEMQMKDLIINSSTLDKQMDDMNVIIDQIVNNYNTKYKTVVLLLGAVFFVLIVVSNLSGAEITIRNIKHLRDMSNYLADKDFTTNITPNGSNEMKALMGNMNEMVEEINKFFIIVKTTAAKAISSGYSINDSSISTAAATNQINANIESISKEFEMINESVERAVYAIDEINSQVKTLVDNNASQTQAIDDSTTAVSNMAEAIVRVRQTAEIREKSAEEMKALVADSDAKINATNEILTQVMSMLDEIGEVITIIDQVTEQTNLLSMNAAIESAHAGEFGKGFAVVAEEIRSLAENTADNASKINEAITNVINKVTEANNSSRDASASFAKIAKHSVEVINSFKEITHGIEDIDDQTKQITQKTDLTATAADKINEYCTNLSTQQEAVSNEINSISNLFQEALQGIREIRNGTEDIVKRMSAVGDLSKESYKNMTELENVLEEFKTTSDNESQVEDEVANSAIENIISPELQAQFESDFNPEEGGLDSSAVRDESFNVDNFDLDNVEEF